MKAKFVRFDILDALSLPEYGRWLCLANKHHEWFENMQLKKYLIDNDGAYRLSDGIPVDADSVPGQQDAAPGQQDTATARTTIDAHELRGLAWFIIVIIAGGYFIFGVPIKDQLATWGFAWIVLSLIWPWLGPWLQNPAHCRLLRWLGWLALAVSGFGFLAYWVGIIP